MISLETFLTNIHQNVSRTTHYQLGDDGRDGGCDCIGLVIGAVRLAGEIWGGTHGSNWAARNAMKDLHAVDSEKDLWLGAIVYKAYKPGDEKYDLPAAYRNCADQKDYYHVGVVTNLSPFEITHCTGVQGGIKRDNTLGKWKYAGYLNCVDYANEMPAEAVLYPAEVVSANGKPVRMRDEPSVDAKVIAQLEPGTQVDILAEADKWSRIRYNGRTGYMMNEFLKKESRDQYDLILEKLDEILELLKKE